MDVGESQRSNRKRHRRPKRKMRDLTRGLKIGRNGRAKELT